MLSQLNKKVQLPVCCHAGRPIGSSATVRGYRESAFRALRTRLIQIIPCSSALALNYHSYHTVLLRGPLAQHYPMRLEEMGRGLLTKERIRQSNGIDLGHCGIVDEVRINEEEDRHVDRLASIQSLFFKTKALYLAKVGGHLGRRNTVGRHPNDILGAFVRSRVKCQRGLSG